MVSDLGGKGTAMINSSVVFSYLCQKREEKEMVLDLGGKGAVAGWAEVDSKGGSDVKERRPTAVKVEEQRPAAVKVEEQRPAAVKAEEQRPAAVKVEEQGSGGSNLRTGVFDSVRFRVSYFHFIL
ncbi:hypothetical protein WN944_024271 [Citrus x changshan-huyou]|uniref:Uncharacterized protein n=1 Tax=Citrus x changshan-huyou TaxID=2935761 RepID=A0AAP0LMP7_9ROSI